MIELFLIGIGTGNPDHLTLEAVRALDSADLILIPRKGDEKADLADLRRRICAEVLTGSPAIVEFDLPQRDPANPDYVGRVQDWHYAIAALWSEQIARHLPNGGRAALMIWGDPSLYDSSLRIAARLDPAPAVRVIPGITSLQMLTAAHAIPLNPLADPVLITTGRRLREGGWPDGVDRLAVLLDGDCAFATLNPEGLHIWWGAYLGMAHQLTMQGPVGQVGARIVAARHEARQRHGWIMDIYILDRGRAEG